MRQRRRVVDLESRLRDMEEAAETPAVEGERVADVALLVSERIARDVLDGVRRDWDIGALSNEVEREWAGLLSVAERERIKAYVDGALEAAFRDKPSTSGGTNGGILGVLLRRDRARTPC